MTTGRFFTFLGLLLACTIVAEIAWDAAVMDNLYHCTDSLGLNYIRGPSSWVHGNFAGNVSDIGDTIAPGWSKTLLVLLWLSFIAASLLLSACATALLHHKKRDIRRGFEPLLDREQHRGRERH